MKVLVILAFVVVTTVYARSDYECEDGCLTADGDCVPRGRDPETCNINRCTKGEEISRQVKRCKLDNGRCLREGRSWTNQDTCCRYFCPGAPDFQFEKTRGCKLPNDRCVKSGGSWMNKDTCCIYSCPEDSTVPVKTTGCKLSNDRCLRNGRSFMDPDTCILHKCPLDSSTPTEREVCQLKDGTCLRNGKSRFDEEKCLMYTCPDSGSSSVCEKGCHHHKTYECLRPGYTERDEDMCVDYVCVDGTFTATKYGCMDKDGMCRPPGEVFTMVGEYDQEYDNCRCSIDTDGQGYSRANTNCGAA